MVRLLVVVAVLGCAASCGVGPGGVGGAPTKQLTRGAGKSVEFKGRPVDVAVAPGGGTVYVKTDRGLVVVDAAKWTVRQELPYGDGETASGHGLTMAGDGHWIYVTTANGLLREARVEAEGKLGWGRSVELKGVGGASAGAAKGPAAQPRGVAVSDDGRVGWVCSSGSDSLAVVDLAEMRQVAEIPVGVTPLGVAVSHDRRTAYVTNSGGRRARDGVMDGRGAGKGGTVSIVDLEAKREVGQVEVGVHPAGLVLSGDGKRLYVANENADTVGVIDTAARKVMETISVGRDGSAPAGSGGNGLAFGADEGTLLVACGGSDAVAVVRLGGVAKGGAGDVSARKIPLVEVSPAGVLGSAGASRVEGLIPAGRKPVAVASDGKHLFVAISAGGGSGMAVAKEKDRDTGAKQYKGTVTMVELPPGDGPRE